MTTWGETIFLAADGRLRAGWRFLVSLLVVFAADFIAGHAVGLLNYGGVLIAETVYRGINLVLLLMGFAILIRVLDGVLRRPLAAMGLGLDRTTLLGLWGTLLGAAMVAVCVVTIAAMGTLDFEIVTSRRALTRALLAVFLLAIAAMGEEVAFRGYPFQKLVEATGAVGAIVITSAFFGLVHAGNPNASGWAVTNTVLFGAMMAIAYVRTRSLWLPWGIHFGWNTALGLGFGLPLSGLRMFAIVIKGRANGPVWMTGGAYGIEGSALGTAVIVAAAVGLMWLTSFPSLRPAVEPAQPLAPDTTSTTPTPAS
jgi:membrane protease YdiL (CAAX protease family)